MPLTTDNRQPTTQDGSRKNERLLTARTRRRNAGVAAGDEPAVGVEVRLGCAAEARHLNRMRRRDVVPPAVVAQREERLARDREAVAVAAKHGVVREVR